CWRRPLFGRRSQTRQWLLRLEPPAVSASYRLRVIVGRPSNEGDSVERDALDLRQLDRERAPEAAAVAREIEAVARGEEDEVGIVVCDRDGAASREAAARLVPRSAGVVGDDERRAAIDDRDDRRARAGRVDEQRQGD